MPLRNSLIDPDMSHGLSIGVVGLGYWGPNLARNFNQLPGCGLSALCDLDPGRLEKMLPLYPGVPIYTSFEEMLVHADLDVVAVATPVPHHFPVAKAALLAGKHVMVEKPLAASVAECEELIELAESRGLNLMVGHTFLYSAPIRMIKKIIDSGDIGEIRYINSQRLNLGLFQKDVNVVWDLAPHDISIILHLLGQMPDFVNCQGNAHITPGIEDVSNLSLRFQSGQFATIQSSWLEPRKVRQMTIVGTRKMIVYDDIEPMEKIRIYDTRIECPPHYDSFGDFHYSYHYGDSFVPYIEQSEPLRQMCQHFIDGILTGSRPLSCGKSGLEVLRILEASSKSLKANGAAVNLEAPVEYRPALAVVNGHSTGAEEQPNGRYTASRP
ncbi:MAG: Gfo/Idh/MocA family oxidoreductase [Akkermansiaceae bacterium]